jgi:hypothetical protein
MPQMRIRQSHLSLSSRILKLGFRLTNGKPRVAAHSVVIERELRQAALKSLITHPVLRSLTRISGSVPAKRREHEQTKDSNEPANSGRDDYFPRLPSCRRLRQVLAVEIDFDVGSHVLEVTP